MLTKRSKTRSTKTDNSVKALVSSTFYSFDEGGALVGSSKENDYERM